MVDSRDGRCVVKHGQWRPVRPFVRAGGCASVRRRLRSRPPEGEGRSTLRTGHNGLRRTRCAIPTRTTASGWSGLPRLSRVVGPLRCEF